MRTTSHQGEAHFFAIYRPITLRLGIAFYRLGIPKAEAEAAFLAAKQPDLYGPNGGPLIVSAESGEGAQATVQANGQIILAALVKRLVVRNPFGKAALPAGTV